MKDLKVVFREKNITLENNERSIVMDSSSKGLTEMYSHIVCQNKGDVLDIGFGMGFSANKMSELADSYTCIEINPQIYKKASEWAKGRPNVNIIFGDWIDIIPQLGLKYDGIFMDTHQDPNYNLFEEYSKSIANKGCILSIFNYFTIRPKETTNHYEYMLDQYKFAKLVGSSHSINWTHYDGENFVKGSNKIKSIQTHII